MSATYIINAFLGSGLLMGLIFTDYFRKYNADKHQRSFFHKILFFSLTALWAEAFHYALQGRSGGGIHLALYGINAGYYAFQIIAYGYIILFIDYSAFKDLARSKKISFYSKIVNVLHILSLAVNFFTPFYFSIDERNIFHFGNLQIIRGIIVFLPIPLILGDIIFSRKIFQRSKILAPATYLLLAGAGSILGMGSEYRSALWPWLSSALLYAYFFIIHSDAKLDALTGIGNRLAFNEAAYKLSRRGRQGSFAIIMIDMDHFKMINDQFGHAEGDNALKDMAGILKNSVSSADFTARYGGDEFIVVIKNGDKAQSVIDKILGGMKDLNETRSRPYTLEMSYGFDIFTPNPGMSMENFLNHADRLMYKNKEAGRRIDDRKTI